MVDWSAAMSSALFKFHSSSQLQAKSQVWTSKVQVKADRSNQNQSLSIWRLDRQIPYHVKTNKSSQRQNNLSQDRHASPKLVEVPSLFWFYLRHSWQSNEKESQMMGWFWKGDTSQHLLRATSYWQWHLSTYHHRATLSNRFQIQEWSSVLSSKSLGCLPALYRTNTLCLINADSSWTSVWDLNVLLVQMWIPGVLSLFSFSKYWRRAAVVLEVYTHYWKKQNYI